MNTQKFLFIIALASGACVVNAAVDYNKLVRYSDTGLYGQTSSPSDKDRLQAELRKKDAQQHITQETTPQPDVPLTSWRAWYELAKQRIKDAIDYYLSGAPKRQ